MARCLSPRPRPSRGVVLIACVLLSGLAQAQTTPPAATPHAPAHPPTHPTAGNAPTKAPPVVQAPKNTHAEKHAPAAKSAPAKAAGPPAPPPALGPPAPTPPPAAAAEPPKGTVTGMPLPRWASLRTDEVNLRAGPGTRYPIDWVYKRRDLPVQIEREFEVWRLVEDQDGIKGWVHQATLVGRRGFVVTGAERSMRDAARDDAAVVAMLKPGVIGRIRACAATASWCEVQVGDYRGWLKRDDFWGTYPGEAVQ